MNAVITLVRREPALFVGLIAAVLTLAAAFGLHLGDQQQAAVMAVVQIVLSLVIRSQVSPAGTVPPA